MENSSSLHSFPTSLGLLGLDQEIRITILGKLKDLRMRLPLGVEDGD